MARAKKPVSVAGIQFDALISEGRTLEATVPEYVVDDGFSVSDTIIFNAEMLNLTLFVSDTPVTWKSLGYVGRTQDVCDKLEELYYSRTPVTIETSDRTYENMVIVSVAFNKSLDKGFAREIPISFKKIRISESKTTTIPDSYGKSGKSGASGGNGNKSGSSSGGGKGSGSTNGDSSKDSGGSILYNIANRLGVLP